MSNVGERVRSLVVLVIVVVAAACSGEDTSSRRSGEEGPDRMAAPLPVPRTEVAGAAWDGRIVVLGGLGADGAASDRVDVYDPSRDEWREGPPLPVPLHHAGAAVAEGRLWVAGGYTNAAGAPWQAQEAVRSLGPGEQTWRDEPPLPRPTGALGLAAADGHLVAMGGVAGGEVLAVTAVLSPGAQAWRPGPDLAQQREHLAATAAGGRVYAIGGRVGGLETNLASVESFAPDEGGWRTEPSLIERRGGVGGSTLDDRPCVAGGEQPQGTIGSVECLGDGKWERVSTLRVPRHGLAGVALAGRLHLVGGGPRPGLSVSPAHEVVGL